MEILNELRDFDTLYKAERIYRLALRNRKYGLAKRIWDKYGLLDNQDDVVVAFGLAQSLVDLG